MPPNRAPTVAEAPFGDARRPGGNGTQSGVGGGGSSGGEKDPRPPRAPYAAGGKVTMIVVPLPTSLSSLMSAPW